MNRVEEQETDYRYYAEQYMAGTHLSEIEENPNGVSRGNLSLMEQGDSTTKSDLWRRSSPRGAALSTSRLSPRRMKSAELHKDEVDDAADDERKSDGMLMSENEQQYMSDDREDARSLNEVANVGRKPNHRFIGRRYSTSPEKNNEL